MKSYIYVLLAIFLGVGAGFSDQAMILSAAHLFSTLFMNFLKLVAGPIVFLSIFSTFLGMGKLGEMKAIGKKIFSYTIFTTLMAASVALALFLLVKPAGGDLLEVGEWNAGSQGSYLSFFSNIIPPNLVGAFLENNVIGIALIAFLLGFASLKLPEENKESLKRLFSSLFKLVLKVTELVILAMPIGIWAFVTLVVEELRQSSSHFYHLLLYLGVVLGANLIQGFVVLPLFLKWKKLSPLRIAKGSSKALLLAFFSKSSNATLPVSLQCAEKNLKIRPDVANFSLPLCTVINMNGCAAFILTTVLFVSQMNGMIFSSLDYMTWIALATIAAIGNAGVPMGCFFLSSAFLISMNVPITILGMILPFYAFLDMVETALNVWSDLSVTAAIDKDLSSKPAVAEYQTL